MSTPFLALNIVFISTYKVESLISNSFLIATEIVSGVLIFFSFFLVDFSTRRKNGTLRFLIYSMFVLSILIVNCVTSIQCANNSSCDSISLVDRIVTTLDSFFGGIMLACVLLFKISDNENKYLDFTLLYHLLIAKI